VTVVHRRSELRASKIMQDRAFKNEKIHFVWDSEVIEVLGDKDVEGIRIQNRKTGEKTDIALGALFVAIGHEPRSDLFRGKLDLDEQGYIRVQQGTRTSVEESSPAAT
jgi:thioredoxin reductase (NADPH)